ncbi:MAG: alpha/beta hydrolase [Azonexus sp.]|jgi:acetyl esterase/lipase|nr:alpha/beta hydrolase [Azonexus sp.]
MTEITGDGTGNIHLPARTIPIPHSISPAARQFLTLPHTPIEWPCGSDPAVWKAFLAQCDATLAVRFSFMKPFPGSVESEALGGAPTFKLTPGGVPTANQGHAILYVHGGGFVMGGGELAAKAAQVYALKCGMVVYAVDYRLAPDHPYPAALDDVVAAYRGLLDRYVPEKTAIIGISAGGGLVASALLKVRDAGMPLPAAAVLLTPECDLTESGDSFETLRDLDVILHRRPTAPTLLYAAGHDLRDPMLSPLFGDFTRGFPPTLLISGTRDLFLSNTVRLHRALRRAGAHADLHVFEAMPHGGFYGAPEDADSLAEQIRFLHCCWSMRASPPI